MILCLLPVRQSIPNRDSYLVVHLVNHVQPAHVVLSGKLAHASLQMLWTDLMACAM